MASPSESISLCKILSESKTIIRSNLHHFQALTVLFVLPLSLCLVIYPAILTSFFPPPESNSTYFTKIPNQYLLFNLLYTIFVTLFSLCAVTSISYSAYHAFYQEPVKLIDSIKFIFNSFLPLVSTIIVLDLILALISIVSVVLALFVSKWLNLSPYFLIFVSLAYVVLLIYIQLNWILAPAVVVVESKWGYEPLRRSAFLIKGNKGVALSMLLYFGLLSGFFFWGLYGTLWWSSWKSWGFFFYVIFGSIYLSCILLSNIVSNVVLYVHCRELHEGLPFENAKNRPLLK